MAVRVSSQRRRSAANQQNLLGFALIACAIVIASTLGRSSTQPTQVALEPTIVAQYDTVMVPVPKTSVPAGTRVKDIAVSYVAFPRHQLAPGAILTLDDVAEATTTMALPARIPFFAENLASSATAINAVIDRIPAGMRAMTLRVDATSAVEGWAGSGSIVDILLVQDDRTSVIAEKVKVLSAERQVAPTQPGEAPNVPSTVTVLVTQDQCLAINTAIPLGRIAFALRSTNDESSWARSSFDATSLRGKGSNRDSSGAIRGYASIVEPAEGGRAPVRRSYALSDGQWVPYHATPVAAPPPLPGGSAQP